MKKNGFTLVELLAVIVILALVVAIATPVVLGVINRSAKAADEATVDLLNKGASTMYQNMLVLPDSAESVALRAKMDGSTNIYEYIETSNEKPAGGILKMNSMGDYALAIELNDVCYYKEFNTEVISEKTEFDTCTVADYN